jgi:urease accessory protein
MLDANATPILQRSKGVAFVALDMRAGRVRLMDLQQSGSAKAFLPRVAGDAPEVVFLNTSGGLTGGDSLAYRLNVGAGCRVTGTTQTAERGYASTGAEARVQVSAMVGAGGRLDWLPQETLLYEHAHVNRDTVIDLVGDAACVVVETIILGRHAMGERPCQARLTDHRMVRRDGRAVWAETLRIDADVLAQAGNAAILGGARAFAVLALVASGAADAVGPVRAVLDEVGCEAAASGWDGKCVIRILAQDGWPLRRQIARVLAVLRDGPLPRVWQMQGVGA